MDLERLFTPENLNALTEDESAMLVQNLLLQLQNDPNLSEEEKMQTFQEIELQLQDLINDKE